MHLFFIEDPRTLYLVTSSQDERRGCPPRVLVFRAAKGSSSQAVVEFLPKTEVDLSTAVKLTSRIVKGCLGLISIADVVTSATEVGNTRPSAPVPEIVSQIHDVGFFCLTSSTWDDLTLATDPLASPGGYSDASDVYMRDNANNGMATPAPEHPCAALRKIISGGTFYYAIEPQWDISSRLQRRLARNEPWDAATYDERFVWNEFIVRSLLDFRERLDLRERADLDQCQFIVLAIQGYVGVSTLALPAPPTNGTPIIATISLISRLGWKRAGTRFNTRGVDDDGNCANFVEASQPAFDRHFASLVEEYGAVHAINLLGTKENEALLTTAYARHMSITRRSVGDTVGITNFDFHTAVKYGGHESVFRDVRRLESVVDNIERFGFAMADAGSNEIITEQKGIFRTNCLDCLDRTNFVQDILSRTSLEQYLEHIRREWIHSGSLWSNHGELWAENGDALSRIYAGTGALNTSFTRSGKRTLAGVLSDATKSVSRAYINNFQDKGKQVAIDMFVGNMSTQLQVTIFDPIHDSVRAALENRLHEYSTTKQCTIFVGTWNLNGRLVGTALLVLVKKDLTGVIRNVEATSHKTGLRGMSGNKGAVGIRLEYHDTTFCFLTAHLAAGHANVAERNADYRTIVNGLHFLKGKTIDSHQNVIWLADTNYRIDLDNERVRALALVDDFDALLAADQLRSAIDDHDVFQGYQEGPLLFRPTYKYDLHSDAYDSGEKMRIPAWTVFALFRAEVRIVDHAKRAALQKLLLENVLTTAPGEKLDEKLASLAFSSEERDCQTVPPPSTDDHAWWDDQGEFSWLIAV
ncbi:hypothetical protein GSI_00993 [Ganoderma sinense ZZ0214-1]|uniref:phosphoinositide 5-phosphatase n=1 Tax=Ganoderma sinense ZZ0214-1 TaxID=1077348 RepID=A0A2G8SU62_9APHY|nr:hypothetical protein GSI_00993 [Ganoderma sinense ZZ0214-1]